MGGQVAFPVGRKRKAPFATGYRAQAGIVVFVGFHVPAQDIAFCKALAAVFDGTGIRPLSCMDPQVDIQANVGRKPFGAAFDRAGERLVGTVLILVGGQRLFAAVASVAAFEGAGPGFESPESVQDAGGQGGCGHKAPGLSLARPGLRP